MLHHFNHVEPCSSVALTVFTTLYNHHHIYFKTFPTSQTETLSPLSKIPYFLHPLPLVTSKLFFVSMNLPILIISCK